jgi:hypothetical protein
LLLLLGWLLWLSLWRRDGVIFDRGPLQLANCVSSSVYFDCPFSRALSAKPNKRAADHHEAVEPEDLAILFLLVGEIGAMALSAALMLVLVWLVSGPN